ncbi:MAG: alpha-L-fucosidase [Opitutaceae bacterium]|nr:alpha-L-fucosidase [Opitutaceae bacterium]
MRTVDVSAVKKNSRHADADALAWWREARFGLFIHWGLYAIPAGVWQGKRVPYIGEWMMFREKIPVATYEKFATQFNPRRFDAKAWVQLAKDAGQRYLVITSKHHDGFAMYDSTSNPYNIVQRTPFARDPMTELARECRKHDIKFCFYYSQDLDWHHPDGAWNTWDYDEKKKQSERYLREKVFPQLRELLTNYGPVGMIWFDTPLTLSQAQSARIRRFVKKLQPACLVSGRIGHGLGDYSLPRDNFLPPARLKGDWETCATLNHTWGFKQHDHAWKNPETLITTLVDLTSKGVNYLLNIGPDANGVVPAPSVQRLRAIGAWLKTNGTAIYGSSPSPFPYEFDWGRITTKGEVLYFHFFKKPARRFRLHGLNTAVQSISPLANRKARFAFCEQTDPATGTPILEIDFKGFKVTKPVTVVAVHLKGAPAVEPLTLQQPDDSLTLIGPMARVGSDAKKPEMRMGGNGLTENWRNPHDWLEWQFTVLKPGTYDITVVTTHQHLEPWSGGHTLRLTCDKQNLKRITKRDAILPGLRSEYFPQIATRFGQFTFKTAGTQTLRLQAIRLNLKKSGKTLFSDGGMQFCAIQLKTV